MRVIAFLLLVALAACASVELGRDFDLAAFEAKVLRGVTTRDEVQRWLGMPAATGIAVEANGERFEQWTYYHGTGRIPGEADARFSILQVKFADGIVRSYNWSAERK